MLPNHCVKKSKRKINEWKSSIFSSMIDVLQIIQDMQKSFKKNFLYCVIKHQKTKMDKELEQKLINNDVDNHMIVPSMVQ